MSALTWRAHHKMLEHSLSTLSGLNLKSLQNDSASFDAQEFPLILSDMAEALLALKQHCMQHEQTSSEPQADLLQLKSVSSSHHG